MIHKVRSESDDGLPLSQQDAEWFLANIDEDAGETVNLAEQHPEIVQRLRSLHEVAAK